MDGIGRAQLPSASRGVLRVRCAAARRAHPRARVARELRSRDPHTLILLDGHARRAAAAQTVQACVRSYGARLRIEPPMVARALSRRAAVCLQRWWRMQPFRERWQLIDALRSVSAAITSAQFYLEADTFFMLTNHAQAQRVRSTLPPAPFADEFGFLPSGQVVLRARALGRGIPNWVPGRPPRHELHGVLHLRSSAHSERANQSRVRAASRLVRATTGLAESETR